MANHFTQRLKACMLFVAAATVLSNCGYFFAKPSYPTVSAAAGMSANVITKSAAPFRAARVGHDIEEQRPWLPHTDAMLLDPVAPRAGTTAPTTARTRNEAPTSKQEAEPCARLTDIWGSVKCSRWVKVRDQLCLRCWLRSCCNCCNGWAATCIAVVGVV